MSKASEAAQYEPKPIAPIEIIRVIVLLAVLATFAIWGFLTWQPPLNFVFGLGTPIVALVLWALFLSSRPVLVVHPFARALIELLLYGAATAAWWSMGALWVGAAFAVVAVAVGLVSGLRAFRD